MNNFDLALLILAAVLVVVGMLKGLVRILLGIAALVASFAVAARYHQPLADRLGRLELPAEPTRLIAYAAIFVGVLLAGAIVAWLMRKMIKAAMLGWADRLGGAALGLVAATLIAALLTVPMVAYFPASQSMLERSVLAPYVTAVADLANIIAPRDLSDRYRRAVENLRRHWRGDDGAETPALLSV